MPHVDPVVNRALLDDNTCFGCGHRNHAGLKIEIVRDEQTPATLLGSFTPTEHMIGFPGIVHGGTVFTALDCLSTWVATLLGPNPAAAWVLRSANVVYHKPAKAEEPLALHGRIGEQGGPWEPIIVRTEARMADGSICVDGSFKVVPLSGKKFVEIAHLEELPENWRAFLSRTPGELR
jgi:acyl-coenzyme A thioesterase PaaI-like protein